MWPYATEDAGARRRAAPVARHELQERDGGSAVRRRQVSHHRRFAARQDAKRCWRIWPRRVESLGGRYVTAEDVGITEADIEISRADTRVTSAGASSAVARRWRQSGAQDCVRRFLAMRAAIELKLDRSELQGTQAWPSRVSDRWAITSASCCTARVPSLVVADVNADNVRRAAAGIWRARRRHLRSVLFEAVDIIAPCALGAVLTSENVARMHAPFIVGAANNQLATDACRHRSAAPGILYAPDYVVNAGGIISAATRISRRARRKGCLGTRQRHLRDHAAGAHPGAARAAADERSGGCHGDEPHRGGARSHNRELRRAS